MLLLTSSPLWETCMQPVKVPERSSSQAKANKRGLIVQWLKGAE